MSLCVKAGQRNLLSAGLCPQMSATARAGHAEVRCQELHPGLPQTWQRPKYFPHHLLHLRRVTVAGSETGNQAHIMYSVTVWTCHKTLPEGKHLNLNVHTLHWTHLKTIEMAAFFFFFARMCFRRHPVHLNQCSVILPAWISDYIF